MGMEDFGILWVWGFCGDSHRFFQWVWGLKFNPHGSPAALSTTMQTTSALSSNNIVSITDPYESTPETTCSSHAN